MYFSFCAPVCRAPRRRVSHIGRSFLAVLSHLHQLLGIVFHVDAAHVQHDDFGFQARGGFDRFQRMFVGIVALSSIGGGEFEDVGRGIIDPIGSGQKLCKVEILTPRLQPLQKCRAGG